MKDIKNKLYNSDLKNLEDNLDLYIKSIKNESLNRKEKIIKKR